MEQVQQDSLEIVKEKVKISGHRVASFVVMGLNAGLCLFSMIYFLSTSLFRNVIAAMFYLLDIPLYFLCEKVFKVKFKFNIVLGVFTIVIGAQLGSLYNFYSKLQHFDDFLHALSGFLFADIGYVLMCRYIGNAKTVRKYIGLILSGFVFSLASSVVWELFEYAGTSWFHVDNEEDCIVRDIESFYLADSHTYTKDIHDIEKTIIYYGNGEHYEIDGYLDIGLYDTLQDMLDCFGGALVFVIFKLCASKYVLKNKKVEEIELNEEAR